MIGFTAVGDVMVDLELRRGGDRHGASSRLHAGGTAANAAVWAASEGAAAACVGRVGADLAGDALRHALERRGVEARLSVDPELPTGIVAVVDGEVAVDRGASARLGPDDLGTLSADAVLVSGYLLLHDDTLPAAAAALERATATWIAVDGGARLGRSTDLLTRAAPASALFLDGSELGDPEAAAREHGRRHRLVCVTLGAAGAVGVLDGELARAAPTVAHPGPAWGAGDAFAAGVLVALCGEVSLERALARGCELGAAAASSPDGWPAV